MNYNNFVLIFKNRFPMGNTYSFITVCEASQKTGSKFFIEGAPKYLEIVLTMSINCNVFNALVPRN